MTGAPEARAAGLSSPAAAHLLRRDGPNELPSTRARGVLTLLLEVLAEPMLLLLLGAAALYVILGEPHEAIALAVSVIVVIGISLYQEGRAENALARLRELSSPRALVLRDGQEQRIAGRDVVVGDVLLLREGDRVPADARLRSATNLSADESILTGESLPVGKGTGAPDGELVFSGSLIVSGQGVAEVIATGIRSRLGQIGSALEGVTSQATPLFAEVRRVVRWTALGALLVSTAIVGINGILRGDWLGGVLAGITLAMALLPEEFPVVLTVFLALGAWRLSRAGVLTRRLPAIESMGAITVLAVDKTGTLTENRMRVALLQTCTGRIDLRQQATLDDAGADLLTTALAASAERAFDPMEVAIQQAAAAFAPTSASQLAAMHLTRVYGLTPQIPAVTHVWSTAEDASLQVCCKGAPEAVFRLCGLSTTETQAWLHRVASLADEGLRVLAVAQGCHSGLLPDAPNGFTLQLKGLLCLADPLRTDVPPALAECTAAGIRVVMITGDHPGTARAIARQAGFTAPDAVVTGAELASLDDAALTERARTACIYARMTPQAKLRLVQVLQHDGEVVAMTGDGVNDAPALKAAHIGVSMGQRGTDVAREAADLVLLHDDFGSLVRTVRMGRGIYDNLAHAMAFIVAVHIPIAGLGLVPAVLDWPLLLLPLHVLFLEFVIDPACSFVFEADQHARDLMTRKPRSVAAPLFSASLLKRSAALGAVALAAVMLVYKLALLSMSSDTARALGFAALIVVNLALILVSRAPDGDIGRLLGRPNASYWWIAGASLTLLFGCLYWLPAARALHFATPPPALLIGTLVVLPALILILGRALRTHLNA